ncbi:DUF2637 domain-containing protein [Nonomuraea wenchangensis]|uniref:DUF2637 domain-containing protein n=1 Tax=Nonomuraea wenchangensis TaxID=568860 RepID=A0A1I0HDK1_9ACTN|nr:DUF2637 domain-containing protein [Nonomuraea wenchangensis]SET81919.1 Protein of unknown function [Nonomuraea wenchangensis]
MRRYACRLLDTGPVMVLAVIAGAGSFTHIRDTASQHGQTGWMSWAVAVCIDLTCVMAARERQRDKKTSRTRRGPITWPVLVLTGGIALSLAANLAQADPTIWGWITAATPAAAFLIAISMLERRAANPTPTAETPELVPQQTQAEDEPTKALAPALVDYARRVADDHEAKHGKPITDDALRAHLGVSSQLATDLMRTLRTA